jgi:hypothetical protein
MSDCDECLPKNMCSAKLSCAASSFDSKVQQHHACPQLSSPGQHRAAPNMSVCNKVYSELMEPGSALSAGFGSINQKTI